MISHNVLNRFSGAVQFTACIDCAEDTALSIKLGLSVKWALTNGADLARAYLADAYLADANLAGADLAGAYLADANLAGANLAGANLADADLADANLARANLAGANLAGADLADADLTDANLAGAKGADVESGKPPLQLFGLQWPVTVTDSHMRIGCHQHTFAAWRDFTPAQIRLMASDAPAFWTAYKSVLFSLIEGSGRTV